MLTIIGCGNTTRSDDGAGIATVQRLLHELGGTPPPGVQIFDAGTAGVEVMFKARGSHTLIVVDASSSGSEPGAVFEVPGSQLARTSDPGLGLHGFRWEHALHAGRLIFKDEFPAQVAVYLIERERLELGVGLSPAVERAVWRVVAMLRGKIAGASVPERGGAMAEATEATGDVSRSRSIRIHDGSFYLDAELFDTYFRGQDSVALLERPGEIALVALHRGAAGGSLAKIRNARGDRVIHAREFLSRLAVDESLSLELAARWDPVLSALTVSRPSPAAPARLS